MSNHRVSLSAAGCIISVVMPAAKRITKLSDPLARLRRLAAAAAETPFYRRKLAGIDPGTIASLAELPFTTKQELSEDQERNPPFGLNLRRPISSYCRLHQTSGTSSGRPLRWLDTSETWGELLHRWRTGFTMMGLTAADRKFFPFSFGPFLGFWSAFEAGTSIGCLCVPGGGMTGTARLRTIAELQATVVFITPTYALHLAELARQEGIDLTATAVRALVLAGEPGGSLPATRSRIEAAWGARVFDHYGLTELGPLAFEPCDQPGTLALLADDFLFEVIDPHSSDSVPQGAIGELVATGLGRLDSPLIRYRTGDMVRLAADGRSLSGGVLGRVDDMLHIRGNNVYPSAIENVLRGFDEIAEYRITVDRRQALPELLLEIEAINGGKSLADRLEAELRSGLAFRVPVRLVPPGTLPRFEMKARRVHEIA